MGGHLGKSASMPASSSSRGSVTGGGAGGGGLEDVLRRGLEHFRFDNEENTGDSTAHQHDLTAPHPFKG